MAFNIDFSGYQVMLPFIEEAKASQITSENVLKSIKDNQAMLGALSFMKNEYGVSVDVFLKVIYDVFSHQRKERTPSSRYVSSLNQTYDWCLKNWDLVSALVESLKSTDLESIVKEQSLRYLPGNVVFPDVTVFFVFNGCDGRGFESEIYMDVTLCAILGKEKCLGLLSHEYHHSCRANFALQCSNSKWKNAFETLFHLESEGIADKIYNLGGVLPDNDYPPLKRLIKRRKEIYENAHKHLAEVEKGILSDADPRKTFSGGSNHPLGNFMADLIERRLGRILLVDCVGNPLEFLRTYNKAAELEKESDASTFVFSEAMISKLEKIKKNLR